MLVIVLAVRRFSCAAVGDCRGCRSLIGLVGRLIVCVQRPALATIIGGALIVASATAAALSCCCSIAIRNDWFIPPRVVDCGGWC